MATAHPWLSLPVWPLPPNWAGGVLERLEWLTDVLRSPSGAEQRRALRLSPRRSFELSIAAAGAERTILELALAGIGMQTLLLPLYHDVALTSRALAPGAQVVELDAGSREYETGGLALLQAGSEASSLLDYEVVVVAAASASELTLLSPTERPWPIGTRVYPLVRARRLEEAAISRLSGRVSTAELRFDVLDGRSWPVDELPAHAGLPVWNVAPNERETLSVGIEHITSIFDHELGPAWVTDTANGAGWVRQQHRFTLQGREELSMYRTLLAALCGRQRAIWFPTFADDLILVGPVGLADGGVYVERCGYSQYMTTAGQHARRDLRIVLADGTVLYRRVVAARIEGDREWLALDATLPRAVTPAEVLSIQFVGLMRSDQDTVEIMHVTDADGVSESVLTLVSAPELRKGVS